MVVSSAYLRFLGLGLEENGSFGRTHPHVVNGCSFTKLFFPSFMTCHFLPLKYRHTRKEKVENEGTWSQEELEQYADAWAT